MNKHKPPRSMKQMADAFEQIIRDEYMNQQLPKGHPDTPTGRRITNQSEYELYLWDIAQGHKV